jgi:hypothetical protein
MSTVPCRPLPWFLRWPLAAASGAVLVIAIVVIFAVAPLFDIGGGK